MPWVPPDDSPQAQAAQVERPRRPPLDERRPALYVVLWASPVVIVSLVLVAASGQWFDLPGLVVISLVLSWLGMKKTQRTRRTLERRR